MKAENKLNPNEVWFLRCDKSVGVRAATKTVTRVVLPSAIINHAAFADVFAFAVLGAFAPFASVAAGAA